MSKPKPIRRRRPAAAAARRAPASPSRPAGDVRRVKQALETGLPYAALTRLQHATGLPLERLAAAARIAPRTLRRRKTEGRLAFDESERVLRITRVFEQAAELFDADRAAATRWLCAPQPGLGGLTPLECAETELGGRAVEDLLGRIEHGVLA